jgi:hypothetical protein
MMFRLEITSLHEFRIFVKLIKNESITEEEIAKILPSFEKDTADLNKAIEENK